MRFAASVVVWVTCIGVSAIGASPQRQWLNRHCADCHADGADEGGFELSQLPDLDDDLDRRDVGRWTTVLRRVRDGEMPPIDSGDEIDDAARERFDDAARPRLIDADRRRQADGRSTLRRLNRIEFETSLSDLLGVPLSIADQLPPDASAGGFDTVGDALNLSAVQMEAYLSAIGQAIDAATHLTEQPPRRKHRLDYRQSPGAMMTYRGTGPHVPVEDGLAMFAPDLFSHFNSSLSQFIVPHTGRYRVRVSARAIRNDAPITLTVRGGGPGHRESDEVPRTLLGNVSVVDDTPQTFQFDHHLTRGQMLRIYPSSLRKMRFPGAKWRLRQSEYDGPAVVVRWVEVDGPIYPSWPPPSHQRLFAGIATEAIADAPANHDPNKHLLSPPQKIAKPRLTQLKKADRATGNRMVYDPNQGVGGEKIYPQANLRGDLHPTRRLVSDDPHADAERLIRAMARSAFRSPIDAPENLSAVNDAIGLAHRWIDRGQTIESALRAGYSALLVSPAFLYQNASGSHMVAERLAYFLWNTPPDETLRRDADSGALDRPDVLASHVDRMLNDPRSERFVDDFLNQWPELRNIDFTTPDSHLYPEYNELLRWSMLGESRAYFHHLIQHDRPAAEIIDSDYVTINDTMARLYGIDGVTGAAMRPVALDDQSVRGGFLTQASVLKITANGTATSPVVRGVWVMDRIVGDPVPPPPPGVPAIEPDIRGATTVREQLDRHRADASCAVCHRRIDPAGMVLESFDPIGRHRNQYRILSTHDDQPNDPYLPSGPPPIRYDHGPVVRCDYVWHDGTALDDVRQLKTHLASDPRSIASAFVRHLSVYASGTRSTIADESELAAIVDACEPSNYGIRSLIIELVQSPLFIRR